LEGDLHDLSTRIEAFEVHLQATTVSSAESAHPSLAGTPVPQSGLSDLPLPEVKPLIIPPPIPVNLSQAQLEREPLEETEPLATTYETVPVEQASADLTPEPAAPVESSPVLPPSRSFELRFGTHWAPRIGIVLVLTALVFFGNFAYHNFIAKLGPGGKIALMYTASFALLGAGAWWQRKAATVSLKNYAQVLFGGGLAAVYFTTYASHHIDRVRVIESPVIVGVMLLAWAGFMVWIADRKKSELLGVFAVGLAYYTSVITRAGSFTLYSNLLLAAVAMVFLLRNRWMALSFGSLFATYAAYGYWRFFDGSQWQWATSAEGLWSGAVFLVCYWVIFLGAVFFSRHEKLRGVNRATFFTINNGAFFLMFVLTMMQTHAGGFWKFSLGLGLLLLAATVLAKKTLPDEAAMANAALVQGLVLVTVGIIAKFSGLQLALLLGFESVMLLFIAQLRKNFILEAGAYVSAAMATIAGVSGINPFEDRGMYLGIGIGALMVFNAMLMHRREKAPAEDGIPRPGPSYYTILALVLWFTAIWNNTARESVPPILAVTGLLLSLSVYVLGVRELPILGQSYVFLAHAAWYVNYLPSGQLPPWWNQAVMIVSSLALMHWWQRQRPLPMPSPARFFLQTAYSLAVVMMVSAWVSKDLSALHWMVAASGLALGITAYALITRAWPLAIAAQIFLVFSIAQSILQQVQGNPPWQHNLAPIAALLSFSLGTVFWFKAKPGDDENLRNIILQMAILYRWTAVLLSIGWIWNYIPEAELMWALALLSVLLFVLAGRFKNQELLIAAGVYSALSIGCFWIGNLPQSHQFYLPNLAAILALLAQQRIAMRRPAEFAMPPLAHTVTIVAGGATLWLFITRAMGEIERGFYLTASWSVLALLLFGAGILLRERVYRWLGLAVLALALGRIFIIDVWKLETLFRILSFMALGVALLLLGFIYNKYQEKFKEWL
jgi:hypothetical protein